MVEGFSLAEEDNGIGAKRGYSITAGDDGTNSSDPSSITS